MRMDKFISDGIIKLYVRICKRFSILSSIIGRRVIECVIGYIPTAGALPRDSDTSASMNHAFIVSKRSFYLNHRSRRPRWSLLTLCIQIDLFSTITKEAFPYLLKKALFPPNLLSDGSNNAVITEFFPIL